MHGISIGPDGLRNPTADRVGLGAWRTLLTACSGWILLYGCGAEPRDNAVTLAPTIDTIATISFDDLPIPRASSPVAVSEGGDRIAIALRDGSGEVLVFSGDGEFLHRIGRSGAGPGEFRDISAVTFQPGSDSLWVLDEGNARVSIFPPDALDPAREVSLRGRVFGAAWAGDTALIVQGIFQDGGPSEALGRAVYSGPPAPVLLESRLGRGEAFDASMRPLTSAAAGGVWVADFRDPTFRRYGPSLTNAEEFDYAAPALEATTPENAELWADLIDTRPAVLGITEDAAGDLWVLFGVPADPLPAVPDPGRALAEGQVGIEDLAQTILARYDDAALTDGPTYTLQHGSARGALLPGGFAYYVDHDTTGEATLTLVRLGSVGNRETQD